VASPGGGEMCGGPKEECGLPRLYPLRVCGDGKARTPNTTFGLGTQCPVMRGRLRIRGWRPLNSTRSAS
jgi:hypothetical protein